MMITAISRSRSVSEDCSGVKCCPSGEAARISLGLCTHTL
jgi:hypothetical protein